MDRISPLLNKLGFWHLPAVCASLLLPPPKDLVDHLLNSTSISYSNHLEVNYTRCPLTVLASQYSVSANLEFLLPSLNPL